jgi:hypothetical protein
MEFTHVQYSQTLELAMSLNFLALLLVGSEIKFPTIGKALGPGGRFARVKEMCQKMRPSATTRDTIHVSSGLLEKRETVIEDSAHRNTTELIAYRFCSNVYLLSRICWPILRLL